MKDYLKDLIQHTHGLGDVEAVKIVGDSNGTTVVAQSEDRTLIINGKFNAVVPGFDGIFGLPNLGKLKTIVNFDEYDDTSNIFVKTEQRNGVDVPTTIHFETEHKDFVNDYRLMAQAVIEDRVKTVNFKGATWDISFEPTEAGILRLRKQASANSEENSFQFKVDGGDLKIFFGDHSTHSANFVFHSGVTGALSKTWFWPVNVFIAIMSLPGDKKVNIADAGAVEITVDSGLATWQYLLPAQTK